MKEADRKLEEVERLLRKVRLAEPPAELKARIVGTAEKAWKETPADIPWRIPLRHLGLSTAAAVLIVSCANYFSARAVAPWQADRPVAARLQAADFEDMPEGPYSPFVRDLLALGRSPAQSAAALLDYVQKVRATLSGAEQEEGADRPGPNEHESLKGNGGTMEYWNGGVVADSGPAEPHLSILPPFRYSLLTKGVGTCSEGPEES
jgi:hypothetical protein